MVGAGRRGYFNSMNTKSSLSARPAAVFSGLAVVASALCAGCVYAEPTRPVVYQQPSHTVVYQEQPRVVVVEQDDYVYYPQYEVYYSNRRRQYGYRDGNAWAWRPAPPGISVNVLYSSPSVRMDFHDAPEHHHSNVVRTYPRNWMGNNGHGRKNDHGKDDHGDDRHDNGKNH